tara:strand:- start:105 stop:488 length:384 start_codon:yes stop_codon:yes gene_type:complete
MRYSAKGRIKMNWKAILKMPVPLDTDTNRDTDYTAAITQYEKDIIEPVLTQYVNSQPAEAPVQFYINYSVDIKDRMHNNIYVMGTEGVEKMGGNIEFIVNVIADIYRKEGYTVDDNPSDFLLLITKQ